MSRNQSETKEQIKKSFMDYLKSPLAVFVSYIVVALLLHAIIPIHVFPAFIQTYLGAFIFLLGIFPIQWAVKHIYRAGYTWNPAQVNKFFLTTGPYRYTRNPIYIGYCCFYMGLFMFLNNIFGLLLIVPLIITLNKQVIAPAEEDLIEMHGEPYDDYRIKVARWL